MADPTKRLPKLPVERALKVIAGRWKPVILYLSSTDRKCLWELKRMMPDITQKVLTQQLREMEEHGLVRRQVFAEVPARVERHGNGPRAGSGPVLLALCRWGQRHAEEAERAGRVGRLHCPSTIEPGTRKDGPDCDISRYRPFTGNRLQRIPPPSLK